MEPSGEIPSEEISPSSPQESNKPQASEGIPPFEDGKEDIDDPADPSSDKDIESSSDIPPKPVSTEIPEPQPEREKKVSLDQQKNELDYVADTLLHRRTEEALGKEKRKEELSKIDNKLIDIYRLSNRPVDTYSATNSDPDKHPISFNKGNPTYITNNGRRVQLLEITGRQNEYGDFFICSVQQDEGSIINGELIPANDIIIAEYLSEAPDILQSFSPEAQRLLNIHMGTLREGEEALRVHNSKDVNNLITQVSEQEGVITTNDISQFIEANKATIPPEQQAQLEHVTDLLDSQNIIISSVQFSELLTACGLDAEDPESIPDIQQYLDLVKEGNVSLERRQAIAQSMREGNSTQLIENLLQGISESASTEQQTEIAKKKNELAEKMMMGGMIGLGAILLLMRHIVSAETRELKKSLK